MKRLIGCRREDDKALCTNSTHDAKYDKKSSFIIDMAERISIGNPIVTSFYIQTDPYSSDFTNIVFYTIDIQSLWISIVESLYNDDVIGISMNESSIAVCEGEHGWDDYLLLHHFDPGAVIDKFVLR
ncbi:MAG: hypothetical protein HYV63_31985 [Candidatus Schekmanbacteria bacterium]|nr:hypothetical protein [Candidatus Schekmanbacteria bacterium]